MEASTVFNDKGGTFTLRVIVLNQPPAFNETSPTRSVPEDSPVGALTGGPVSATDPEGDAPLTYSLLDDAGGKFGIDPNSGQILVGPNAELDFETNPSLAVTVGVSDGKTDENQTDPDNAVDTTIDVTISVADADDPGVVSLSWPNAYVGVGLTATLYDEDGVTGTLTWAWQSSSPGPPAWAPIVGANTAGYTPVTADGGQRPPGYRDLSGHDFRARTSSGQRRHGRGNARDEHGPYFQRRHHCQPKRSRELAGGHDRRGAAGNHRPRQHSAYLHFDQFDRKYRRRLLRFRQSGPNHSSRRGGPRLRGQVHLYLHRNGQRPPGPGVLPRPELPRLHRHRRSRRHHHRHAAQCTRPARQAGRADSHLRCG